MINIDFNQRFQFWEIFRIKKKRNLKKIEFEKKKIKNLLQIVKHGKNKAKQQKREHTDSMALSGNT